MTARRRIDPTADARVLRRWAQERDTSGGGVANVPGGPAGAERVVDDATTTSPADRIARRQVTTAAVRYTLEELVACVPGHSVEVRVPPFGATQVVADTIHCRGALPSVIETDIATWLALATDRLTWQDVLADGTLHASGEHCDLSAYLPLAWLLG